MTPVPNTSGIFQSTVVGQIGVAILNDGTAWIAFLAIGRKDSQRTFQLHLRPKAAPSPRRSSQMAVPGPRYAETTKTKGQATVYRCHFCQQSSSPGEKLKLVVTQTRVVTFTDKQGTPRQMPQIVEERARCRLCTDFAEQKDLHAAVEAA